MRDLAIRYVVSMSSMFSSCVQAVGAEMAVPQDPAKMAERRKELLDWNRRTMVVAYEKVGTRDARWDKPALEALELAARFFSRQVDPVVTNAEIHKAAMAAIEAGCYDPYVLYLLGRSAVGSNAVEPAEALKRSLAISKAISTSRYPAFRRAGVIEQAATNVSSTKDASSDTRKQAERDYDAVLGLFAESVAKDEHNSFWELLWLEKFKSVIAGYRKLGIEPKAALERVDAKLATIPELKVLRLQMRGQFQHHYGWELRSSAFAPQVGEKRMKAFVEQVSEARKAFSEAWRLRPDDAFTATYMLDIEKAIGGGDREAMELWFDRSMKANGDAYHACLIKLDWLDPMWYGSPEEMVEFGRACYATKNWQAAITLLVGDAHLRYRNYLPDAEKQKYMRSPENWTEIKSAYEEFLKHNPDSDVWRSKYAMLSYDAGYFQLADKQFQILGDRLTSWPNSPFVPLPKLKQIRSHVKQWLQEQAAKKKGAA